MTPEEMMKEITRLNEELTNAQQTINGLNDNLKTSQETIGSLTTDLEKSKQDTKFYFDKVVKQFDKSFNRETPQDIEVEVTEIKSSQDSLDDIVNLF